MDRPRTDRGHPLRRRIGVRSNRSRGAVAAAAVLVLLVLTGCASPSAPAAQGATGRAGGFTSSDGRIKEIGPGQRGRPITFTGVLEDGKTVTSAPYRGKVLVLNTWYAACPPCRAEARDLQAVYQRFRSEGVDFLGVNLRDEAPTARAFEKEFGVTYPTTLDAGPGTMQLALTGQAAPNAVPTTLVLDRKGRVAARLLGRIPSRSTLASLIQTVLAEPR